VCAQKIASTYIDNIYDNKDLEITLGRRRTFVSEDMMTYDDGKGTLVFDPNDISVYVLPKGFNKDMLIQSDNTDLRTDKMIADLNSELNILSSKVGFGNERYKFDKGDIQTATGIISANSDMFRTMKKHEQVLENALKALVKAIIYACNEFTNYSFTSSEDVTIAFDDSIIEDKGAEQVRAQTEVGQGLKSKKTYLTEIKGMSEKEAEDELQKIQDEKMSNREAFGFEGNTEEE
jgi:A118 family predicted phage portal protein